VVLFEERSMNSWYKRILVSHLPAALNLRAFGGGAG